MNERELESVTHEIVTLCCHLDAAEFRLLELIRRLDATAPWGAREVKSCAHWHNWRGGIALGVIDLDDPPQVEGGPVLAPSRCAGSPATPRSCRSWSPPAASR